MLRDFYLYMQQIGRYRDLVLQSNYVDIGDGEGFSNLTMCSEGLEGLADDLVGRIHVSWGAGYRRVDIHTLPNELMTKHLQVVGFPISKAQRKKFERYLPSEISINWIEKEKTKQ